MKTNETNGNVTQSRSLGSRSPFDVKIKKITARGLRVELEDGSEGWLPADEWSYEQGVWEQDQSELKQDDLICVVAWGKALEEDLLGLSQRRVERNPWDNVTSSWYGQRKHFAVTRLLRRYAIGEIEPGLQARIDLQPFDSFVRARDKSNFWENHIWVALGDVLGGIVRGIRFPPKYDDPMIILDADSLLMEIDKNPAILMGFSRFVDQTHPVQKAQIPDLPDQAPNVNHIFLLDNEDHFRHSVSDLLEESGYKVTKAASEEEAFQIVQNLVPDSIQMALIDLHLVVDMIDHDGLKIATQVAERHPHCKIVLMSAEDIGPEHKSKIQTKIKECKIRIAAYLQKVFTVSQLHKEISLAASAQPKELKDVLAPILENPTRSLFAPSLHRIAADNKQANRSWSIQEAVDELARQLPGVVVHIFAMHPLSKRGESIAHCGEGLYWEKVQHKLDKSPVSDTAIDPQRTLWIDNDVDETLHLQGKHLWLRYAMDYRSALGIPIWSQAPVNHCLLAFHPEPNYLNQEFAAKAELCAERVGRAIERERLKEQSKERSLFETAGMSFACLAHELRNNLVSMSTDTYLLEKWIYEACNYNELPSKAAEVAHRFSETTDRALMISEMFCGVQSQGTPQEINIIECLDEAIKAIRTQIPKDKTIEVRRLEGGLNECHVYGDRTGLIILFFNLLLNAVQQIDLFIRLKGLVWIECHTYNNETGQWIQIDISDTGPGIHTLDLNRIFDIGYSTKPEGTGTGFGLHICRQVISTIMDRDRYGKVEVTESVLCVGTTFSVHLPISDSKTKGE